MDIILYCFCKFYNLILIIEKFNSWKFAALKKLFSLNQSTKLILSILDNLETQLSELLQSYANTYFQLTKLLNQNQLSKLFAIQIPKHYLLCISALSLSPCVYAKISAVQQMLPKPGNTKGGSITVPLTSCLTSLESAV